MVTYANLRAEMARTGLDNHKIAETLQIAERSFRNKLNGLSAFTLPEAKAIRDVHFPNFAIEDLFKNTHSAAQHATQQAHLF